MVDDKTFAEQTKQLLPTFFRISMSILHADADAQDAVQQALMKAWENRMKIAPEKLRAWITRTMINECHNIYRQRTRVAPIEKMENDATQTPAEIGLLDMIYTLPENLRIPLLLKYSEGYTEKEIASAMAISLPTVKNRLYRARKELARALETEVTFE